MSSGGFCFPMTWKPSLSVKPYQLHQCFKRSRTYAKSDYQPVIEHHEFCDILLASLPSFVSKLDFRTFSIGDRFRDFVHNAIHDCEANEWDIPNENKQCRGNDSS